MADDQHVIGDELYTQVGKALSIWSQVEETLCSIYAMSVVNKLSDPIGAAASGFWAIISFEAKLKMTDAAIRFRVPDNQTLLDEWNPLFNGLRKKARNRGELAHGTVITWNYVDSKSNQMMKDTFFVPSLFREINALATSYITGSFRVSDSPDTRPEHRLYRKDIKQRRKGFMAFKTRLKTFHGNLYRELERIEKDRALRDARVLGTHKKDTPTE